MNGAVISLCDETGNMVKPWAEAGYECWCFDVEHPIRRPRTAGNIHYVYGDARSVRRPTALPIVAVFAFPPCTHVAVSGCQDCPRKGGHMLRDALEIFEACRQVCEWSGAPYCIENPVSKFNTIEHIGKPDHFFEPWHYTAFERADHYTKKTSLWIGNGFVVPPMATDPTLAGVRPDNRIHFASPGDDRAAFRSATPLGFARAVFAANAPHLKQLAA